MGRVLLQGEDETRTVVDAYGYQSEVYLVIAEGLHYSVVLVTVEEYQVKAGVDCLLNLHCAPLSIHITSSQVLLNLGDSLLLWRPRTGGTASHCLP